MACKEQEYNIRCFLEDGTPLTKENQHLTCINQEVTRFQAKVIVSQINKMPKEVGKIVFERLTSMPVYH
ncbi:hypothetical protein [Niameybacter massiliensis]|uniref:hypothetical protein n=1 Tax=Niameybacter massiliensis TaxID=1658108 RepID=UPI0006B45CED|nr:hypothetical protein [Niameybacter massiliensis]